MITLRFTTRLIGLVSTAIVARILAQEDYGVMTMAVAVLGFILLITDSGVEQAVIRHQAPERKHYDTAWTANIISGLIVGVVLFIVAPYLADFYREPRVEIVVQVIAISPIIGGLTNIGIAEMKREMRFDTFFRFSMSFRFISVFATIAAAIIFRNYWALVIGELTSQSLRVLFSYTFHPYRPRFSLQAFKELWSFSALNIVKNIGAGLTGLADKFTVGRIFDSASVGIYGMSNSLAAMINHEVVAPLFQSLYPGYSKIMHDRKRLARAYIKVVGTICTISIPVGLGFTAVSENFVTVVLGSKWENIVSVLQIMSVVHMIIAISNTPGAIIISLGRIDLVAIAAWMRFAIIAVTLYFVIPLGDLHAIAYARGLPPLLLLILWINLPLFLIREHHYGQIMIKIIRPLLIGLAMFFLVRFLHLDTVTPIISLILDASVGILFYTAATYGVWRLSGRPDGLEEELISRLPAKLRVILAPR